MNDIEARIEAETAAAMRQHALKETHRRLQDARADLRNLFALDELPADIRADLLTLMVRIEDVESRIEPKLSAPKP